MVAEKRLWKDPFDSHIVVDGTVRNDRMVKTFCHVPRTRERSILQHGAPVLVSRVFCRCVQIQRSQITTIVILTTRLQY